MKVSVCGRGGSGKSTIVSLLTNEARARGYHVLVVDTDGSNSGFFGMLGFDQPPTPLMERIYSLLDDVLKGVIPNPTGKLANN